MKQIIKGYTNVGYDCDLDWSYMYIGGTFVEAVLKKYNGKHIKVTIEDVDMNNFYDEYVIMNTMFAHRIKGRKHTQWYKYRRKEVIELVFTIIKERV